VGGELSQVQQVVLHGERPEDRAVRVLAESVDQQLTEEVQRQELERPAPIVLRVRERPMGARSGAVSGELPRDGDSTQLVEIFMGLPDRQMVILGEPGAGKSVQATLLAHGLLRRRDPNGPVPVLFQMSSWRPHTVPLKRWMEMRLLEDHPLLDHERKMARRLVEGRRIIPILDGLDEITAEDFKDLINKIEHVFGKSSPFVLTCRTAQYEDAAAQSSHRLSRAIIFAIEPVRTDDAIGYLEGSVRDRADWRPVLEHLRAERGGTLAGALATPLMLFLARAAYDVPRSDPSTLLSFAKQVHIEKHLLEAYVPAVYADYLYPRYPERKARRWLTTLASGPREIRWWNISSPFAELASWILYAIGTAWIAWLVWNTWFTIAAAVGVLIANGWLHHESVVRKGEIVATEREAADPRSHLRRYRQFAAVFSTASGIVVGVGMGAWLGSIGAGSATSQRYALASGFLFGAATLMSTAWGRYLLTRLVLALRRRLPLRLDPFIEDAGRRGVLRRPGAAYQFRHARVQDVLRPAGPALLSDEPHTTLPSSTPRTRQIATLFVVPSIRLYVHIVAILIPFFILGRLLAQVPIDHESGIRPMTGTNYYCSADVCTSADYLAWSVPNGGSVTTVFRVGYRFRNAPIEGIDGQMMIHNCDGATISIDVTTDGSSLHSKTITEGSRYGFDGWRLPSSFARVTVTFRRLDTRSCTANLEWESAGLITDQFFGVK
jgi:hypothetical protein